ncbi:hypothetical protein VTN49DRAFT_7902 [Thermomyces lanuginosus]|uniref:uncharacterized protein n=1 Tax=Thermomyces lanuginosus TaxID=5541 RepID=UPI003742C333
MFVRQTGRNAPALRGKERRNDRAGELNQAATRFTADGHTRCPERGLSTIEQAGCRQQREIKFKKRVRELQGQRRDEAKNRQFMAWSEAEQKERQRIVRKE